MIRATAAALLFAAVVSAQAPGGTGDPSVRLYILDCGMLKNRDAVPYGLSPEQAPPRDLANICALVVHPRGTLLWETGLHESVNETPANGDARPGRPRPGDRVERTLRRQLDDLGYTPGRITHLALSHSHWDHTGNAGDYLGSTWLVQRAEPEAMRASRVQIIDGDHDVFGDRTVRLLFTPGHTPGHQALLVRLPKTGTVILSGDLYHFPEELTLKPVAAGANAEQVAASKARVQALVDAGAQLWIQHDMRRFATLKQAPAYYD